MEAYLRGTASPDWENLASQMANLTENIRHLQNLVAGFEQSEPRLTEAQNQQLERLKVGLATLTVFANNTNQFRFVVFINRIPHVSRRPAGNTRCPVRRTGRIPGWP